MVFHLSNSAWVTPRYFTDVFLEIIVPSSLKFMIAGLFLGVKEMCLDLCGLNSKSEASSHHCSLQKSSWRVSKLKGESYRVLPSANRRAEDNRLSDR